MIKKEFTIYAPITKSFIKKVDGVDEYHVIAIASDTRKDYANERMSVKCIESFVNQCQKGIDILDGHSTSFAFGKTVDSWKETEADAVAHAIDIKLNYDYPQSRDLFTQVEKSTERKQLSIGGWVDADAGISIEIDSEGTPVRVFENIILDHIAVTRPEQACNPRAGFISAMAKDIFAGGEMTSKLFGAITQSKSADGQINSGITSDAGMPAHYHEMVMHIDAKGDVVTGETGIPLSWYEDVYEHTHKIEELTRTTENRGHYHLCMGGSIQLSKDNRIELNLKECSPDMAAFYYDAIVSKELPQSFHHVIAANVTSKVSGDNVTDVFDSVSVDNFIGKQKCSFEDSFCETCDVIAITDKTYDSINTLLMKSYSNVMEYGLMIGGVLQDEDVVYTEKHLNTTKLTVSDILGVTKTRLNGCSDIAKLSEELSSLVVKRALTDAFECAEIREKLNIKENLVYLKEFQVIIDGSSFTLPKPVGDIASVAKRIACLPSSLSKSTSWIADGYTASKSYKAEGHFHKYVEKGGDGVTLTTLSHYHVIKSGQMLPTNDHVHKIGDSEMKNLIAYKSSELAQVEQEAPKSFSSPADCAYYNEDSEKGAFLHHENDEAVLRGVLVSYAELMGIIKSDTELSDEESEGVRSHLEQHLTEFGVDKLELGDDPTAKDFFVALERQGVEMSWFEDITKSTSSVDSTLEDDTDATTEDLSDATVQDDDVSKSLFSSIFSSFRSKSKKVPVKTEPTKKTVVDVAASGGDHSILDIADVRNVFDSALAQAMGGDVDKAVEEMKAIKVALGDGGLDSMITATVERTVKATVLEALTEIMPEFVKSLEDIAKALAETVSDQKDAFKNINSIKSRIEKLEGSPGSSQVTPDGDTGVVVSEGGDDLFGNMFSTAMSLAKTKRSVL